MKHFEILGGKAYVVELPEEAKEYHIAQDYQGSYLCWDDGTTDFERQQFGDHGQFKFCDNPRKNWRIVSTLAELCNCFVCGGDGKETCNNPDHGFLDAIGGVVGANESSCPVCGHDPNHKVKNGGDCECCNGLGFLTTNKFIDACGEYGYDDSPMPPESFHSAIRASGWYLDEGLPGAPECGCTGPSDKGSCDGCDEYMEAQSRTLARERCLLLRRVE